VQGEGGQSATSTSGPTLRSAPQDPNALPCRISAEYAGVSLRLESGPLFYQEDSLNLSQSKAIAWYLAPSSLKGETEAAKAQVLQWMDFAYSDVASAVGAWLSKSSNDPKRGKENVLAILKTLNNIMLANTFFVGERLSLADISLFSVLLPAFEVLDLPTKKKTVNVLRWFDTVKNQKIVMKVLSALSSGSTNVNLKAKGKVASNKVEQNIPIAAVKKEVVKEVSKVKTEVICFKDPFNVPVESNFDLQEFKNFFSSSLEKNSIKYFWENVDLKSYSLWFSEYNTPQTLTKTYLNYNLISGMFQRLENLKKYAFASVCVFGEDEKSSISGIWLWRGQDLIFPLADEWKADYQAYTWTKLNPKDDKTVKLVNQYLSWSGQDKNGLKFTQGKIFK